MEVTQPLVTVCIPNHNHGHLIGRCIESVLAQTYSRFEVIISDDGSTDNSDEIIRGYKDPRIRYVQQPRKLGIFGNFKACLSLSHAPYSLFIGADDYLKPRMLEKCVSVLEANPDAAFCHTAVEFFNDEGKIIGTTGAFTRSYVRDGPSMIEDFLYGKRVALSSTLFRRTCFDEIDGWSIPYQNCFDAEMWFRMLLKSKVGFVGEILTGFRSHPTSESWQLLQLKEDLEHLQSMFDRLPESLQHLQPYRNFVFDAALQRALNILSTFPPSVQRDETARQIAGMGSHRAGLIKSPNVAGVQSDWIPAFAGMTCGILRRGLERLPASLRYKLGAIADTFRRARIHRLAKAYESMHGNTLRKEDN